MSQLRHRTVRTETLKSDLHLHNPLVHKQVTNHLFAMLFASHHSEEETAQEFWRVYRFLIEGRPISELECRLIERDEFVAFFNAVKAASDDSDGRPTRRTRKSDEPDRDDEGFDDHGEEDAGP